MKNNLNNERPQQAEQSLRYQDTPRDLDAKIQKLTSMILEQYPELSKQIEVIQTNLSDPSDEDPVHRLRFHFDELQNLFTRYKQERNYKSGNT